MGHENGGWMNDDQRSAMKDRERMRLIGPFTPTEKQQQALIDEIDKLDDEELEALDDDADEIDPVVRDIGESNGAAK